MSMYLLNGLAQIFTKNQAAQSTGINLVFIPVLLFITHDDFCIDDIIDFIIIIMKTS